ncbi:MAG: proline--tRNA ligase [Deltaproteobacteria bacterium]|nr:proline--tRNA ligase [Deltaproteobacteria bacterium]MBW2051993.1 proline--tRNA ligase [Deltaproteobacteria bacterium]MBW2140077.1 proline--tRNA ligase [Deltaproteobacteria bacterium]
MRRSRLFLPTLKEDPADAEVTSHKLLIRAGFIRKLATGIFSYLPLGLMALRRFENIVREEMLRAGAQEILMPAVQPSELWEESGRWNHYGKELLRFRDRHDNDYCFGPTHEEVITDLIRREVRSYRDLPMNLYQIQTKFRDEIRPRFGLMRGREFGMKDAYSFDIDEAGAAQSYRAMFEAYNRIFKRCGLRFSAVEADSGNIGGSFSHEFMVLADTGEDAIVNCPSCGYAANTEKAEFSSPEAALISSDAPAFKKVLTQDMRTVEEVTGFLGVAPKDIIKTLIYKSEQNSAVVALVRGDHELNETKLKNILDDNSLEMADPAFIRKLTGAPVGFSGPVGLKARVLADYSISGMTEAVVGANEANYHLTGVIPQRDFTTDEYYDLRMAEAGDSCPRCGGELEIKRGIEVGHVFKLGTKYSEAMNATYLDPEGQSRLIIMGCYGIGIGRTVAAAIEQNHDEKGIIWPVPLAPFQVVVLPLQVQDEKVRQAAEALYLSLQDLGVETLLDDRKERAGIKFKDADLVGIPLRLAISQRTLAKNEVEFKERAGSEVQFFKLDETPQRVREILDRLFAEMRS